MRPRIICFSRNASSFPEMQSRYRLVPESVVYATSSVAVLAALANDGIELLLVDGSVEKPEIDRLLPRVPTQVETRFV